LSLIVLIYLFHAIYYIDPTLTPDAETAYFPYAKKIVDGKFEFLLHIDSILIAPVSYLWPALFGGTVLSIKYGNLISGVLMVVFTYGIGRRLHSHTAGLMAAFLFAGSPLLVRWVPTVLSEPPFYLFTLMWVWALGEVFAGNKWAIPLASIALGLSILTRTVWFYPSFVFLFLAIIWLYYKPEDKLIAKNLILAQLFGLLLPIAIIIKNTILFSVPAISMGSGISLYLGTNIMTGGFEPPHLGLTYASGPETTSLLGSKEHMLVAMEFLKDRSFFELFEWFYQKISWNLLFSPLNHILIGYFRAIELALAIVGLWWGVKNKSVYIIAIGGALILQLLQTSLVLYNVRYSTDNIELLLIPLVAVGVTVVYNSVLAARANNETLISRLLNVSYGRIWLFSSIVLIAYIYFELRPIPVINIPKNIPTTRLFDMNTPILLQNNKSDLYSKNTKMTVEIDVPKQIRPEIRSEEPRQVIWEIHVSSAGVICNKAKIGFIQSTDKENEYFSREFYLNRGVVDGIHRLGTMYINDRLFPYEDGKLHLEFECSSESEIVINRISLIAPHFIDYYWDRILKK